MVSMGHVVQYAVSLGEFSLSAWLQYICMAASQALYYLYSSKESWDLAIENVSCVAAMSGNNDLIMGYNSIIGITHFICSALLSTPINTWHYYSFLSAHVQ